MKALEYCRNDEDFGRCRNVRHIDGEIVNILTIVQLFCFVQKVRKT